MIHTKWKIINAHLTQIWWQNIQKNKSSLNLPYHDSSKFMKTEKFTNLLNQSIHQNEEWRMKKRGKQILYSTPIIRTKQKNGWYQQEETQQILNILKNIENKKIHILQLQRWTINNIAAIQKHSHNKKWEGDDAKYRKIFFRFGFDLMWTFVRFWFEKYTEKRKCNILTDHKIHCMYHYHTKNMSLYNI